MGTSMVGGEQVGGLEVAAGKAMVAGVGHPLFPLAGEDMEVLEGSRGKEIALEEVLMAAVEVVAMAGVVKGLEELAKASGEVSMVAVEVVAMAGAVKALEELAKALEHLHHLETTVPERRSK